MTLAQLLDVQAHDTAIDQLNHRLETLPEFDALKMLAQEKIHLDAQRSELAEQAKDFQRDQKRLEDDVALIEDRHGSESKRLYSGTVTAHKDLEAIQHELETLERRQRTLEDQVLEVMEVAEPVNIAIADLDTKLASVVKRQAELEDSLAAARSEIAGLIEQEQVQRAAETAEIENSLIDEYEKARKACGGVGVAKLVDKRCLGCRLKLAAIEYDRIRKLADQELAWCDCGRILVRSFD